MHRNVKYLVNFISVILFGKILQENIVLHMQELLMQITTRNCTFLENAKTQSIQIA